MKIVEAVKKAIPKKFIEFTGEKLPENVRVDGKNYQVFNKLHFSWINFKLGDFIAFDDVNDMYPVDKDYFAQNYDIVEK